MLSFEAIEIAREQIGKEYSFIDMLQKKYRLSLDELDMLHEAKDRIKALQEYIIRG